MGPEEDFARLEKLGFVRNGFMPPPNEGATFVHLRSGWMVGVPFLSGPYVVIPRHADHVECDSLSAAIARVRAAPPLSSADRESLRQSLNDNRSPAAFAEEEAERLTKERREIRRKMKSPEYQRMWREWNRFLVGGVEGGTPSLDAYNEAKRAYLEAQEADESPKEEAETGRPRRRRRKQRGKKRPDWTPERFDFSTLPGLLVALPVAVATAMLVEWMFIYLVVVAGTFVTLLGTSTGVALAGLGGGAFGFAAWSWTSLSRAVTVVVGVLAFSAVASWIDFASLLDFPMLASAMPVIGAGWASIATREMPPPRLPLPGAVACAVAGVVVALIFLGPSSTVLPGDETGRSLWLSIFLCHGVLSAVPAAELAWVWTRG